MILNQSEKRLIKKFKKKYYYYILEYCIQKWGKSKYNKKLPKLKIFNEKDMELCGQYNPYTNSIEVHLIYHSRLIDVCSTVIHEYTHYLQCMEQYLHYTEVKGKSYKNHPYEITARNREIKYRKECRDYIINRIQENK